MTWQSIVTTIIASLTSIAAAGPWGIAGMVTGLLALLGGSAFLISKLNASTDSKDEANASSDAGSTGQSIQQQAQANQSAIDGLRKLDPVLPPALVVVPPTTIPVPAAFADSPVSTFANVPVLKRSMSAVEIRLWDGWKGAVVDRTKLAEINSNCSQILRNKDHYERLGKPYGVPFYVIGLIHMMECSFDFNEHLHNGDSLRYRTVNEPAGRPPLPARPPFAFDFSADDCIKSSVLSQGGPLWDLVSVLDKLERFNGLGYRNATPIRSPYLWSYTNRYTKGKYDSDGHYNPNLISRQCGCVPVLLALKSAGVNLNEVEPSN